MLSYVLPSSPESANANNMNVSTSLRNTNLNLSPQVTSLPSLKPMNQGDEPTKESQRADVILGNTENIEFYDECTRLIDYDSPAAPRRHQSNTMNSSNSVSNNNVEDDTLSEELGTAAETTLTVNSDASRQSQKKPKLGKLGPKGVGLKRVSFGSSKGSMVETLVFETPTPLSEHVEPSFACESNKSPKVLGPQPVNLSVYQKINLDDSGIEVQEESERSIVRVSIYQSNQPQQICPPDYLNSFEESLDNSFSNYNIEEIMTTSSTVPGYDRQQSTDSGWDNPFRPGGDLSREADEIVNMIRGGKPITPIEDHSIGNGNAQKEETCNGNSVTESVTKTNATQSQSAQNGTNKVQQATKSSEAGTTSLAQVSKQVVPGPTSASHVVIDDKKNKKKGCCVIQ